MALPRAIGAYEVVRELGRGGMGVVYEVRHPDIPRPLALKLVIGEASEATLTRFGREAQALARVRHPGVVQVHQLSRAAEGPILVTELVEGRSLKKLIEAALPGTVDPRAAATLVRALADAVSAVHAQEILHRDLKPDNVIVRPDGAPVLLDFGVARDVNAERLTVTGTFVGTPSYMSPEQAEGLSPTKLAATTDVYGLGAILFELLAGRPPFEGGNAIVIVKKVLTDEPRWPSADRDVPWELEAICRVAMTRERLGRYPTAAALRDDLDAWLAGRATTARERFGPPARGRGALVAVMGVVVVGIAVALAVALSRARPPGPDVTPATTLRTTSTAPVASRVEPRAGSWEATVAQARRQPFGDRPHAQLHHPGAGDTHGSFVDDRHLVTFGDDLRLWSLDDVSRPLVRLDCPDDPKPLAVHALGAARFLVVTKRRAVEVGGREPILWYEAAPGAALSGSRLLPDGALALAETMAAHGESTAQVARIRPGERPTPLVSLSLPTGYMEVSIDARGERIAVVSCVAGNDHTGAGELFVLDGGTPRSCELHFNGRSVALSSGPLVAVGMGAGRLALVELPADPIAPIEPRFLVPVDGVARSELISHHPAHEDPVTGVAFSLDGARLWSASGDARKPLGQLRGWDALAKTERPELARPITTALWLRRSPDGRTLASGTSAGTVDLWIVEGR
jgi:hypothetical protein